MDIDYGQPKFAHFICNTKAPKIYTLELLAQQPNL
jgi:hypothetical protein